MKLAETPQVTRAIIYARVSSDKARGRSVREQETECRAECERRGWPVAEANVLVDNDRSASRYATRERPSYNRLRTLLRPGDVLVTWEASRLSRDLGELIALRDLCLERGVAWSYGGSLIDLEEPRLVFDGMIAEQEAMKTRARVLRAHAANVEAGRPHSRPSYGYLVRRDPASGKSLGRDIDAAKAKLVREAARRVLAGHSLESVVKWMAIKDPASAPWTASKLRRILVNPSTAGLRHHKGKTVRAGTWQPILSQETHDDLLALFGARKAAHGSAPTHLLSGIAECAHCNEPLRPTRSGKRPDGSGYRTYRCPAFHISRSEDEVDAAVLAVVEAILTTPASLAALAAPPPEEPGSVIADDLRKLRDKLQGVEDQIVDDAMPADVGARLTSRLTERIAALEAQLSPPPAVDPVVARLATAADPVKMWNAMALNDQRQFVRATMTVVVARVGKGRWHAPEDGITVTPKGRTCESR